MPSASTSGSYTISWGAASGTVTAYPLYEASSASFSGQQLVHAGTARSAALSGRGNGTYYYRVRACFDTECRHPLWRVISKINGTWRVRITAWTDA